MRRSRLVPAAVLAAVLLLGACSPDGGEELPDADAGSGDVRVPADVPTIQEAVDQAADGDVVVVGPGTYTESVQIRTPNLTLRGTDRNGVVIDGGQVRGNGIVVTAPGVTVENLTVRGHNLNGILVTGLTADGGLAAGSDGYTRLDPEEFPPLQGFAVRSVTTYNNGLYGVYAFDANDGVIEDSYASGHADSGFYVGQCRDCRIVVRGNVAEHNAVGYEQTNASDSVTVVGNRFTDNRVGASLLSDYQEAFVPQHGTTFAGNVVSDNAQAQTPAEANGVFGVGVAVTGGQDDVVARNRVEDNPAAGIWIASTEDLAPDGNRIEGNVARGNGVDLAYTGSERAPGAGSCAADNTLDTTLPADLLDLWPCPDGGTRAPGGALDLPEAPPGISFRDVPAPPEQPSMTAADLDAAPGARAPAVDADAIAATGVPAADLLADRARS
ncbi:right-handed parallel beta-helix repeat-containing protein [Cellulosimicrobium arenosum]|uniref:Right-handed parallel beta-helix repeat-containing protein n=1 Tax=Cellulosimicrobium arenosum TaxID=2708133 RepID=A0A927J135_9MICO|nr:right-handed parallel beta-helix repeat-containing protein [Cellulosimicrobium arenosum]MBD8079964.1 right-handed parallel beta-helix repeat-containing protein [Cellulosimicrobium arenosum]